jgi:periplasmic divalent cation tolerance protein
MIRASGAAAYAGIEFAFATTLNLNRLGVTCREPMLETTPPIRIVLTTCASPGEASRLARILVEERLAACATLLPAVQSIYHWQGQIEYSTETLVVLKTGTEQIAALEARLLALHSYQTPEFLVLDVGAVSHPYLEWLQASLNKP